MSRNSVGNYTLPGGNPVVSGSTITTTWANNTLNDIGVELTNSLDRQGRGAMLAPLQHADGSSTQPAVTFANDPDSGLYRAGAGDVRMQINASQAQQWTATGTTIPGTLTASGGATLSGANTISGVTTISGATTVTNNVLNVNVGGPAIALKPASADHVYLEFYADSDAATTRSGFVGYSTGGTSDLSVSNQMTGGDVHISASGGNVVVDTQQLKIAGTAPTPITAVSNALTKSNIVKAWATLKKLAAGGVQLVDGFNISSVTYGTTAATLTFAGAFANTNFAVLVTSGSGAPFAFYANNTSTTTIELKARNLSSGVLPLSEVDFSAASGGDILFSVLALGPQ